MGCRTTWQSTSPSPRSSARTADPARPCQPRVLRRQARWLGGGGGGGGGAKTERACFHPPSPAAAPVRCAWRAGSGAYGGPSGPPSESVLRLGQLPGDSDHGRPDSDAADCPLKSAAADSICCPRSPAGPPTMAGGRRAGRPGRRGAAAVAQWARVPERPSDRDSGMTRDNAPAAERRARISASAAAPPTARRASSCGSSVLMRPSRNARC